MEHRNVHQLVSTEFKKAGIPFLIVGGFAVNYHKVARSTGDFDLLMREADYPRALGILEQAGYREVRKEFLCARLRNEELFFWQFCHKYPNLVFCDFYLLSDRQ